MTGTITEYKVLWYEEGSLQNLPILARYFLLATPKICCVLRYEVTPHLLTRHEEPARDQLSPSILTLYLVAHNILIFVLSINQLNLFLRCSVSNNKTNSLVPSAIVRAEILARTGWRAPKYFTSARGRNFVECIFWGGQRNLRFLSYNVPRNLLQTVNKINAWDIGTNADPYSVISLI